MRTFLRSVTLSFNFGSRLRRVALFLTLALSALPHCVAHSQQFQPLDTSHSFSAAENTVLARLDALGHLPDGAWQMHAGDLPHGEDPSLDTREWPIAKFPLDTEEGAVWFRQWITLPENLHGDSLNGAHISFQFGAFAHGGIQEIVYFNGRRVALGESLEPIPLVDDPKPGERILIAVKLLHSSGGKHVTPAAFPVTSATGRPNPVMLSDECFSAAALLPSLITDRDELAVHTRQVSAALAEVDLKALDDGDSAAFDASLTRAQERLEILRPVLQKAKLLLVGQSHIDSAWLWPWSETVDAVRRTFFTTLQLMEEYPDFRYTQSAMQYYAWMEEKYPDVFQGIKQRIQSGQWEVVGGMWVEPDFNMPDGETTARELLLGKLYARQHLGVDVKVGWNPDSFGYSWQLPQMYRKAGIDSFMTEKMSWNESGHLPFKLFWWESPDGSKILTYLGRSQNSAFKVSSLVEDLVAMNQLAPGSHIAMPDYGVGDHGGGVTRSMLDEARLWTNPTAVFPRTSFAFAGTFFDDIRPTLTTPAATWNYQTIREQKAQLPPPAPGRIEVPTWRDELYLEFHRGTYTSQARHKLHMRESEEQLLNAEKLSSIAWLDGLAYPAAALAEVWKKAAFNGFHDLAAGSGTANTYVDAERDFDSIRQVTAEASRAALTEIAAHADTSGVGTPLLVFNPLAWSRRDIAEFDLQLSPVHKLEDGIRLTAPGGREIPVQVLHEDATTGRAHVLALVETPSMGYTVLHADAGPTQTTSTLKTHGTTLENALLRVEIDPQNGCITHLVDKRDGFDSIAVGGCGNQLQTFTDNPKNYDAWNIDIEALDTMKPITAADSVKVIETGPLRASIRVKRHWGSSSFTQDVILYDGIDRVDVVNNIDWHETHVLLKAAFPLAAASPMATYEIPYGTIDRPTTRSTPVDRAKFEVPALRWADLGDGHHGLSLLNESKYGYDCLANVLRISLLRSPVYPDPNTDRGMNVFRFSLYPHAGRWQQAMSMRRGWEFNYPLQGTETLSHSGLTGSSHSFVELDDPAVVLTAIKRSEHGDGLIFRLFDWSGKPSVARLTLPGKPTSAAEVNLLEDVDHTLANKPVALHGSVATLSVDPFEIKTVLVNYPEH